MVTKTVVNLSRILTIAGMRFFDDGYTYRASALAFTTLLAIVPLLLVVLFFMTIFPPFASIMLLGENYILVNFVPTSASAIEFYFQGFMRQAAQLPALSIAFLFFTTVLLVHTIEETLNDIWQVTRRRRSKKVFALLSYWLLFLLLPVIIGLSVFLSSYLLLLSWISDAFSHQHITTVLLQGLPLFINTLIFTLVYVVVPNSPVRFRDGILGGFIAALLFECARVGFAYYLQQFPSYALIYGAFAVIPIFLVWMYIFWFIILFGALVTHAKIKHSKKHSP